MNATRTIRYKGNRLALEHLPDGGQVRIHSPRGRLLLTIRGSDREDVANAALDAVLRVHNTGAAWSSFGEQRRGEGQVLEL